MRQKAGSENRRDERCNPARLSKTRGSPAPRPWLSARLATYAERCRQSASRSSEVDLRDRRAAAAGPRSGGSKPRLRSPSAPRPARIPWHRGLALEAQAPRSSRQCRHQLLQCEASQAFLESLLLAAIIDLVRLLTVACCRRSAASSTADVYFPSKTSGGGSISLSKATAVFAKPRCASAPL